MSDTLSAPLRATSIAAPVATAETRPAGVNFLAFRTLKPHVANAPFATRDVELSSCSSSFLSLRAKRRSQPRAPKPASAAFRNRSIFCFSIAESIRLILAILSKSKQTHNAAAKIIKIKPKVGVSSQLFHPSGSDTKRKTNTNSIGKKKAKTSLNASKPIPLIGNSFRRLKNHPPCGASCFVTLMKGRLSKIILINIGTRRKRM